MVVPVLMTSCQVSEKPKIGPVTAQATTTASASTNVFALPAARVMAMLQALEKRHGCRLALVSFAILRLAYAGFAPEGVARALLAEGRRGTGARGRSTACGCW